MSDFQDEQGLGELPADLYAQYMEQFKPSSAPISGVAASAPAGLSSDSPKYPVSVDSVFQTLPVNAVDFVLSERGTVDSSGGGITFLQYTTDSSHVDVLKKLKWNVSPRRYFLNQAAGGDPLGLLTISVGGIVVNRVSNITVADSGEMDLNIIAGLSTIVKIVFDFSKTYGLINATPYSGTFSLTSSCYMNLFGVSLLSRGLPSNFEIAS